MIGTSIFIILLALLEFCYNKISHTQNPFELIKSQIKLNELFNDKPNRSEILERYKKTKFYNDKTYERNNTFFNTDNETDYCSEKTDELLKYFLNPENATITFDDFKGFILYSALGLNDYGDYTNCVNTQDYNYLSLTVSLGGISARMGLCYYKACNATYFNKSKSKLIDLINLRYGMNLNDTNISFSNPKENMEEYRKNSTTGFIIGTIILSLIALISFIKLVLTLLNYERYYKNDFSKIKPIEKNPAINDTYHKLEDKSKNLSTVEYDKNQTTNSKKKPYELISFLENFDMIKNTKAIFNISNPNKTFEYLRVFDGVRVLSTCWVVWGHVFFIAFGIGPKNFYDVINLSESFIYCILTSASVSVDVFFYMSGFLLYFNLQKYMKNVKNKVMFFFVSLFQRYIRLLPFYFFAIFYVYYLLPFLIDSGKSDSVFNYLDSCKKYWWANVFYIQNHISYKENGGHSCVGHSWYLGDDMMYFIATTLIILFIKNRKVIQYLIIWALFIGSCIWSIVKVINNNFSTNIKKVSNFKQDYFFDFYVQPFARITPYLMGILYCELFFETDIYLNKTDSRKENLIENTTDTENPNFNQNSMVDEKENQSYLRKINIYLKNNDTACLIIFIVSLIFINYNVFINKIYQKYDFLPGWEAFVLTFNKIFFIMGLGNIIHLIFLEKFSFVKDILSAKIFTQMSRLTYGVYILHYYVILVFFYNTDSSITINFVEYSFFAIGIMVISLFISYVVGILFESPVINMLKFMKGEPKTSKRKTNKDQSD